MNDRPTYPRREKYFAHQFVRILHKSCAAQDIGPTACYLLCVIAHTEDAGRYAGPARFWRSQLMETLGFTSPKQLVIARQKAVDAGWLVYQQQGTRAVGEYFVAIPGRFSGLSDAAIEPPETPAISSPGGTNRGTNGGSNQQQLVPFRELIRHESGFDSGTQSGPLPIPVPDPIPKREAAPVPAVAGELSFEDLIKRWNRIPGIVHCRGVTEKRRKAFRARIQDPAWRETLDAGLAAVAASAFLRGDNDRGWRADIDWFLQPDSLTKSVEGKYGNGAPPGTTTDGGLSIYRDLDRRRTQGATK